MGYVKGCKNKKVLFSIFGKISLGNILRETRERIVARVKIVRKSLALERASGFAFSYHKTKNLNNHYAVMVVIKVIGH